MCGSFLANFDYGRLHWQQLQLIATKVEALELFSVERQIIGHL